MTPWTMTATVSTMILLLVVFGLVTTTGYANNLGTHPLRFAVGQTTTVEPSGNEQLGRHLWRDRIRQHSADNRVTPNDGDYHRAARTTRAVHSADSTGGTAYAHYYDSAQPGRHHQHQDYPAEEEHWATSSNVEAPADTPQVSSAHQAPYETRASPESSDAGAAMEQPYAAHEQHHSHQPYDNELTSWDNPPSEQTDTSALPSELGSQPGSPATSQTHDEQFYHHYHYPPPATLNSTMQQDGNSALQTPPPLDQARMSHSQAEYQHYSHSVPAPAAEPRIVSQDPVYATAPDAFPPHLYDNASSVSAPAATYPPLQPDPTDDQSPVSGDAYGPPELPEDAYAVDTQPQYPPQETVPPTAAPEVSQPGPAPAQEYSDATANSGGGYGAPEPPEQTYAAAQPPTKQLPQEAAVTAAPEGPSPALEPSQPAYAVPVAGDAGAYGYPEPPEQSYGEIELPVPAESPPYAAHGAPERPHPVAEDVFENEPQQHQPSYS